MVYVALPISLSIWLTFLSITWVCHHTSEFYFWFTQPGVKSTAWESHTHDEKTLTIAILIVGRAKFSKRFKSRIEFFFTREKKLNVTWNNVQNFVRSSMRKKPTFQAIEKKTFYCLTAQLDMRYWNCDIFMTVRSRCAEDYCVSESLTPG